MDIGANYEWYYNITVNDQSGNERWYLGFMWIGYDADGERINNPELSFSNSAQSWIRFNSETDWLGIPAQITDSTGAGGVDVVATLGRAAVEASAEIPTEVRLHLALHSRNNIEQDSSPPVATSPFTLTAGVRANSSVSFSVNSVDGSSATTQVTQGDA